MEFHEKLFRSGAKSISYRILVIASDLVIIFAITKRLDVTIGVTILTNVATTLLYFLHERLWNKISWGRVN